MPFDGVVVKCIVNELSDMLLGGRIEKIFQPESDEIILNVRAKGQNLKLLLSANPSYPRVHFTESSKDNPAAPPVFCMLLRKHLSGGKITGIEFHDFERIITIEAESMNELGDLSSKKLIIEIMGRHSNIILVSNEGRILDSIKHVDSDVNRIREIMPGRPYILPPPQDKHNPEQVDIDLLFSEMKAGAETSIEKQLLSSIKGFSPLLCREICFLSGIDDRRPWGSLSEVELNSLKKALSEVIDDIENNRFNPCIIYDGTVDEKPIDFHCLKIKQYVHSKSFDSMSNVLDLFYFEKDRIERSKQKKADVLKLLNNNIDRCNKKLALQYDKLREVSEREKIKLAGELITANIYAIQKGAKKVSLLNYYSENQEYLEISLDENLTPQENAQRYFKQYVKAKNAYISTSKQVEETLKELDYLEGVLQLLENCSNIQEIDEVRQELSEQGYLSSKHFKNKFKKNKPSAPLRFRSSDGFDIFIGKNNKQNDQLTLKLSASNDLWMHTQNIPGSHVIIKNSGQTVPDSTLLEAALLAAYHSKAKFSSGVPVDYTYVKNVKKPPGSKPGMVTYTNFKTIIVTPDEKKVNKLKID